MPKKSSDEDSDYQIYRINTYKMSKASVKFRRQLKKFPEVFIKNQGKWTGVQKSYYLQFLHHKRKQILDENYRKEMRIFKQMSLYVKTRTPDQCRSHHQKMIKIHHSIDKIFEIYKKRGVFIRPLNLITNQRIIYTKPLQKIDMPTAKIQSVNYFSSVIKNQILLIQIHDNMIEEY